MDGNNIGYFVSLFIGIYFILRFRSLGKKVIREEILVKYIPLLGHKWNILFAQLTFLITGLIIVLISLIKLLQVLV